MKYIYSTFNHFNEQLVKSRTDIYIETALTRAFGNFCDIKPVWNIFNSLNQKTLILRYCNWELTITNMNNNCHQHAIDNISISLIIKAYVNSNNILIKTNLIEYCANNNAINNALNVYKSIDDTKKDIICPSMKVYSNNENYSEGLDLCDNIHNNERDKCYDLLVINACTNLKHKRFSNKIVLIVMYGQFNKVVNAENISYNCRQWHEC